MKEGTLEISKNTDKNRIILIGNGFDLAHGMKTSYSHFIDWFWKNQVDEFVKRWSNDKKAISNKYENTVFRYENDVVTVDFDGNSNIEKYIKENDEMLHRFKRAIVTYKNTFLELIEKEKNIKNWVDIEDLYFKRLIDCKDRLNKENYNIYPVQQLNKEFRFIKTKLKEYLQIEDDKEKIDEALQEQISKIIFFETKEKESDKDILFGGKILLLNFNYTNTDSFYKQYIYENIGECGNKPIEECIHIHGNINDGEDSMIFGYGDEMSEESEVIVKLNNNDFLENVKSIKYVESLNYQRLLKFVKESKAYEVFILGHSCGNSDRTLLNWLFQHEENKCKSIRCFYHEKTDNTDNYKEMATNIYRSFSLEKKGQYREILETFEKSDPLPQENGKNKEEYLKILRENWNMVLVEDDSEITSFYMGKYPVTQKQWKEIMSHNPSHFQGKHLREEVNSDDLPVEMVSWYDAVVFCNRLSEEKKLAKYYNINGQEVTINEKANGFRLPVEKEWVYAAHSGKRKEDFEYSGSNNIDEVAWYSENSGANNRRTHEVGTKKPNGLGIHDMSGNVWEWCYDLLYDESSDRVLRGGSWSN